jgi:hypothetical protein
MKAPPLTVPQMLCIYITVKIGHGAYTWLLVIDAVHCLAMDISVTFSDLRIVTLGIMSLYILGFPACQKVAAKGKVFVLASSTCH